LVTSTVICPPNCLYRYSATCVWSFSHGSRLPQSCRIGTPALASGARLSIGGRFRHQAVEVRVPSLNRRDLQAIGFKRLVAIEDQDDGNSDEDIKYLVEYARRLA
jgi:hypothetical protein